ncbi:(2Fe-2S)-binding protein, partial [Enterobacter intestinihominis]
KTKSRNTILYLVFGGLVYFYKRQAGGFNCAAAVGFKVVCGTNCGSCVPELKGVLGKYFKGVRWRVRTGSIL